MKMEKSDDENVSDNEDDKDDDFNIKDYQEDIDSDESFEGSDANKDDEDANENKTESEHEYTGPILPGGHRFDKKFLCVRYPGVVNNPEKAIETLGGLGAMSTAVSTPNRRLELRFRPNDGYCKPTCGDRSHSAGFLLRIRVKKRRVAKTEEAKSIEKLEYEGPYDLAKLNEIFGNLGKGVSEVESRNITNSQDKKIDIEELSERVAKDCNVESINYKDKQEPLIVEREIPFSEKRDSNKIVDENFKDVGSFDEKKNYDDLSQDENYEVPKLKVLGRVESEFTFQNLCDFQYLPITKSITDPKVDECIYDSIYPAEIPSYRWLKNKVPYFLPPPAFSRMDSIQQYSLKTENDKGPENVIGKTRKRRAGFSNFIQFTTPETPSEPPAGIETAMKIKFLQKPQIDRIKKIFEERPIWSKNALMCITNFTSEQLKFLLPSVAYYFMTGPWRIMWVKLGYDPRTDPHAKKYQTLDYRLKAMHGLETAVMCKRTSSEYTLPYKSASGMRPRTTILTSMHDESESQKKDRRLNENVYIYREGIVPPSRQMFYQYCDVHVDEIQEMLAKLPKHLPGVKCDEKRGWLPSGFSDQCREIINRQVRAVLRKQMNIPEDHPTTLPRKRKIRKNTRLSRLTAEELKMTRRKKRKDPEDSDDGWSSAVDASKKKKSTSTTQ